MTRMGRKGDAPRVVCEVFVRGGEGGLRNTALRLLPSSLNEDFWRADCKYPG